MRRAIEFLPGVAVTAVFRAPGPRKNGGLYRFVHTLPDPVSHAVQEWIRRKSRLI